MRDIESANDAIKTEQSKVNQTNIKLYFSRSAAGFACGALIL